MFSDAIKSFNLEPFLKKMNETSDNQVLEVLSKSRHNFDDLPVLLSPSAINLLSEMADVSAKIKQNRFGNIIQLYIPLYLSNKCSGSCIYCGFQNKIQNARVTLTVDQVLQEADFIYQKGFRNLLLVSGTTNDILQDHYLNRILEELSHTFTSVSIEIQPLEQKQYQNLVLSNLDGVTLYQETYNPKIYETVHKGGSKGDFLYRLDNMDRAACSGVRKLNIGALLGLMDFREEAAYLAFHCKYLIQKYWRTAIGVSFPRLRESEAGFKAPSPVSDRQLAQMIFAFRIIFPDIDLNISTREPPALRDLLAKTAVTYMSAGSKTNPGGYHLHSSSGKQFDMEDTRPVEEICDALHKNGLDVVWKDWNEYKPAQPVMDRT
jgi:2-iminoacetate synthase